MVSTHRGDCTGYILPQVFSIIRIFMIAFSSRQAIINNIPAGRMLIGGRQAREAEVHPVDWLRTQLDTFEQELRDAKRVGDWGAAVQKLVGSWEAAEGWEEESKEEYDEGVTGSREEASCMMEAWRCFSGVLEEGVRHLDRPEGVQGWGEISHNHFQHSGFLKNFCTRLSSMARPRAPGPL